MKPLDTSSADIDLPTVITNNRDAIIDAVGTQFQRDLAGLQILLDRSFVSAEDGTPSFWVQDETGAYGVNGTLNAKGALTNITVTKIDAPQSKPA